MSNYKIETKCIQSGYEPGNGEPRVLPIYQSTTFKYNSSDQIVCSHWRNPDIFIQDCRIQPMMQWQQKSAIWKAELQQC